MDESIKQKIEKQREIAVSRNMTHREYCEECQHNFYCEESKSISESFRLTKTQIILENAHLIDDKEQLNYLCGDDFYYKRKEIISKMIAKGIHPNDIKYQSKTALYDSTLFQDVEFAHYLIDHGARPDQKTIKCATPQFLAALMEKYGIGKVFNS